MRLHVYLYNECNCEPQNCATKQPHRTMSVLFVTIALWSQIKLTSYDFTDLHITGEFDNRPGTGRFLRIFSCVVTYRTGAGTEQPFMLSCNVYFESKYKNGYLPSAFLSCLLVIYFKT